MINHLIKAGLELLARGGTFLAAFLWGWTKKSEDIHAKAHKDDRDANNIRNRVRTDADYRERVRREFDGRP